MPDQQPMSEPEARARAHAWLEQQHSDAHELLVTLLHYVPERDRTQALHELTTGELRHLVRLLADATDLRQVAGPSSLTSSTTCPHSSGRTVL